MVDTARSGPTTSLRKDAILEAVAFAAEQLLLAPDWRDAADRVLAHLGIAAGVSRAYVIRNHLDGDGRGCCRQLAEWCAPGVTSQVGNPDLDGTPWDEIGFGRWVGVMSTGGFVAGRVDDLPIAERSVLARQDIRSIASFPVLDDGDWWGLIGFDDCRRDREWGGAELDALRAAASVLGAAIHRHRMDVQAREAEARSHHLVEGIPAVTYTDIPGPEGVVMGFVSPQVTSILGYPPEAFIEDPRFWVALIHPDDRSRLQASGALSPNDPAPFDEEYRMHAADGRWVWIHDTSTAVFDDAGNIEYFLGFATDVTQRREAEDRLRAAEEQFRLIVEQSEAVFYTRDIDPGDPRISRTTYIAPGNADLLGYAVEEIQDDPLLWRRILHPDDRQRVLDEDARCNVEQEDRFSMDYRVLAKDGKTVWIQDEARQVRLPGRLPYWQGFLIDVTERKEAEAQLQRALAVEREATQRLRTLDEMKNTFLQAVSHDLRTPLAAILGLAITLERGDVHLEESDARDLARRIAENARRLDRLVTNLLDLDRLARGIVAPKLQSTDVGALVRRVLAESELVSGSRMQTDIEPVVVPVDGAKVERIVENLLANTARHTPAHATIWVSVLPCEGGVMLTVEDDGDGVEPTLRETIFEPFQQGPAVPQHSPGVGVGLTLVKRFAELHGGRAWVEERDGGGASFRVFLPGKRPAGAEISLE